MVLPNFISRGRLALTDSKSLIQNSGLKMASKTGEAKVTTCCLGDIKSQITPEKLPFYGKEQLLYYCKELRLKTTGEKRDLIERLSPLGKCPDLFDRKVG